MTDSPAFPESAPGGAPGEPPGAQGGVPAGRPLAPLDVHVVAHTHWDREWYHTAERFRQRLVALAGELLAVPIGEAEPFLLDGQAIVLEDLLAVHPEWEEPLGERLRAGVLEAGPWYVLADELIPSGEVLVRNLLAGRRVLARFGAVSPPVCYSPDAFGHSAALPALAHGFGLPVAVVWRGYGGPAWPDGDTARWQGHGCEVLLWHLPRDGYEYGNALPVGEGAPDEARERWRVILEAAGTRAATGVVLLPNGADHHAPQRALSRSIALLNQAASGTAVLHPSTLRQWAGALATAAAGRALPVVRGELRQSRGHTWSLQGTFATRSGQKRAVARVDRMLRRDVEPWQAVAWLTGAAVFDTALLHAAWKTVLATLPHDTLCGCSVDAVARALDTRVRSARSQAQGLRQQALNVLLQHDEEVARTRSRPEWAPQLVIRNRAARPRGGVAEVTLLTTLGDVPVGPGSGGAARIESGVEPLLRDAPAGLAVQPVRSSLRHERRESPRHYPDNDAVHALRALVWVPAEHAVPATGLASWPMQPHRDLPSPGGNAPTRASTRPVPPVSAGEREGVITLANERLRVTVRDGRIEVQDLSSGRLLSDALWATWQRDVGDSYTSAPRDEVVRLTFRRAQLRQRGPLRARADVLLAVDVPAAPAPPALAFAAPEPEQMDTITIQVVLSLTLDADASFLRVDADVRDGAPDHRLCLVVASGVACEGVTSDAAFGPVYRAHVATAQSADGWNGDDAVREAPVRTAPLHRWVAVQGGQAGCALLSDGLAEYEAWPDGRLAVTLVRATGELSRGDLPERPGHAGWPARIPRAQGPGRLRARFGLLPAAASAGALDLDAIERAADDLLLPLTGTTWRDAPARSDDVGPALVRGIELRAVGVRASSIALADDGHGVVLRAVNLTDQEQEAEWIVPAIGLDVRLVRLDETSEEQQSGRAIGLLVVEDFAEGSHREGSVRGREVAAGEPVLRPQGAQHGREPRVHQELVTRVRITLAPRAISSIRLVRREPR